MSRLPRCGFVLAAATGAVVALGSWLLPVARSAADGFDDRLTSCCAVAGLLAATWLWVITVAVVVEAARTGDGPPSNRRRTLVPAAVRRGVLAACGVATLAALTAPDAHADTPGRPGPPGRAATVASVVAHALRDDAPPDRGARRSARPEVRDHRRDGLVTVTRGDCLWDIAARDLHGRDGPHSARLDDSDVDRRWHEIYAANRAVIGPDPDLIRPAQRLRLPR